MRRYSVNDSGHQDFPHYPNSFNATPVCICVANRSGNRVTCCWLFPGEERWTIFRIADELPEEVQSLIVHLQKLDGTAPTLIEFGTHIHAQGLHLEPDHWKDFYYQWRIPTRNDNERYVLFGHFSRKSEAELRLWEASIRGDDGEVWSSATRFHHQDNQASRQNGGPLAEVARVGRETHACHVSVSRGHRAAETRLPSRQEQSTISTALMSQRCSTGRTISAIPRTLEVAEDASTARNSRFSAAAAVSQRRRHLRRLASTSDSNSLRLSW